MAKMVQAFAKWRFGPYRALVDRTGDSDEDAEVGVLVDDQALTGNFRSDVIELAQQLTQTPFNVSGSRVFSHFPRLAKFVADRVRARVTDCANLETKLAADFQAVNYHDVEQGEPPTTEVDDGVHFVDLLAMLEMFTHALFVNPHDTESELARFLDYYGSACEEELYCAEGQGGLYPAKPRPASALGTPSPHCIVIATNPGAFYNYVSRILPPDFMIESQCEPAQRALQALPLHPVIAQALTGKKPDGPSLGYEVLPLWPYFSWKTTK